MKQLEAQNFLNLKSAMELLGVSRATINRWLQSGKLKGHRVGRQWRFSRSDLERFVREGESNTPPGLEEALQSLGSGLPHTLEGLTSAILSEARTCGASAIHLNPGRDQMTLTMRVDSRLQRFSKLPKKLGQDVVRFLARTDSFEGLEVRAVPARCARGEALTLHLTSKGEHILPLETLIWDKPLRANLEEHLNQPWGLTILAAPVGSGKTTTLHSILKHWAGSDSRIVALEAPNLQMPDWALHLSDDGLPTSALLSRAINLDPDAVFCSEVFDKASAVALCRAALSGLRVLIGLNASSASEAMEQLIALGVPAGLLTQATRVVLVQHLCPRLCPTSSDGGYRGKFAVHSVLEPTPDYSRALNARASLTELRRLEEEMPFGSLARSLQAAVKLRMTSEEMAESIQKLKLDLLPPDQDV